jgi:FKBP-type peptidyl-prolyl cis-trans isomerase 2
MNNVYKLVWYKSVKNKQFFVDFACSFAGNFLKLKLLVINVLHSAERDAVGR